MPVVIGPVTVLSATYAPKTKKLSITAQALGETLYPGESNIEVSLHGSEIWAAVDTIDAWADEAAEGSFDDPLPDGSYDVRATSSDGIVSDPLSGAFSISGSVVAGRMVDISICCCLG